MIKQISVFAENKRSTMLHITEVIADAGINIITCVAVDTAEFGIVRLLVSEPERAKEALEKAGYQCKLSSVLGVFVDDGPGGLRDMLAEMDKAYIRLNYLYDCYDRQHHTPMLVISTDDLDEVASCLTARGLTVV